MRHNARAIAGLALVAGLIIGTIGWLDTEIGHGALFPPSGLGWLEVAGFVLVIPSAIFLKASPGRS